MQSSARCGPPDNGSPAHARSLARTGRDFAHATKTTAEFELSYVSYARHLVFLTGHAIDFSRGCCYVRSADLHGCSSG